MRTLILSSCLLLATVSLAAVESASPDRVLAAGSYPAANHPRGGWMGLDPSGTLLRYGMILTNVIKHPVVAGVPMRHVIFDFDHPDSSMRYVFKGPIGEVVLKGHAFAWGTMDKRSDPGPLQYQPLGLAEIGIRWYGGVYEGEATAPGVARGGYQDVVFTTDGGGCIGAVIMPGGDVYLFDGMDDGGVLMQFGDWEGDGYAYQAADEALWAPLRGRFATGQRGRPAFDDEGAVGGWVTPTEGGDDDGEVPPVEFDQDDVVTPPSVPEGEDRKPSDIRSAAEGAGPGPVGN